MFLLGILKNIVFFRFGFKNHDIVRQEQKPHFDLCLPENGPFRNQNINWTNKLDYTRRARWPFRAFCVDGLYQITQYWYNYLKFADRPTFSSVLLENAKVSSLFCPKHCPDQKAWQTTDTRTDGRTHGRTNIKFWGPSTQKALKGKNTPQSFFSGNKTNISCSSSLKRNHDLFRHWWSCHSLVLVRCLPTSGQYVPKK